MTECENKIIQEAFEIKADDIGMCLDQNWCADEKPYENGDTALAFELFKAGWQASASREGHKLVTLQPSNEVIVAIEKKVENQLEASGINQDPFRLDGETIYEAMIGTAG